MDDSGQIHYSEEPPEDHTSSEFELQQGATEEETRAAQQKLDTIRQEMEESLGSRTRERRHIKRLGPLPNTASSHYLDTVSTGIHYDLEDMSASLSVVVRIKDTVPSGVLYIEAAFSNPADPHSPIVTGKKWATPQLEMTFTTPRLKGLRCRNYEVLIKVCHWRGCIEGEHEPESKLYGEHHQLIQSRIDMNSIQTPGDMSKAFEAMNNQGGYCP